jgi:aminoglycoside 3-N-acetyltransferase
LEAEKIEIGQSEVVRQLRALGVEPGGVLLVHASFRAVRPVEGGPLGLIGALREALGPRGTLVMPTMTGGGAPFDAATTPTRGMGVVAETFRRQPGVLRGDHPTSSFAALGRWAAYVAAPQPLEPPHGPDSPVGRIHALAGQVLLLGVGHDTNTTVHLAEVLADAPYQVEKSCLVLESGRPVRRRYREHDHCTRRFALVEPILRECAAQAEGRVGHAAARLVRSCDVVLAALGLLRADPTVFLHPRGSGCAECDRAWGTI